MASMQALMEQAKTTGSLNLGARMLSEVLLFFLFFLSLHILTFSSGFRRQLPKELLELNSLKVSNSSSSW